MDKRTELKGLLKEVIQENMDNEKLNELEKRFDERKEAEAKLFEENKELKAKLEDIQGKMVTVKQNTGINTYKMKGYNPDLTKNFRLNITEEQHEEMAKGLIKALTSSNTGAYAVPTEYGNQLLGLAELSSVALAKFRVINANTSIIKMPAKGTRPSVDMQASGTANTTASTTLGQKTWTIDKRIGAYEEVYMDVLKDENFDVIGEFIEPGIAAAAGQDIDDKCFNGTDSEFTSDIADLTAALTVASGGALTYSNLNTMFYGVAWERMIGSQPEWFMNRAVVKDISGLLDSQNRPLYIVNSVNGRPAAELMGAPLNMVPAMDSSDTSGSVGITFMDPKQCVLCIRPGSELTFNPYIKGKEDIMQIYLNVRADFNYIDSEAFSVLKWT